MNAAAWSHPAYEAVARLLGARTGLSFLPHNRQGVEQGIRRAMARTGSSDPAGYRGLIERDANAFDDLVVELTVGETYFFREPDQFEFIRRQVLPEIQRRRGAEHVLRAWSTACASGEEAYSLAILFKQEGIAEKAHVLATDISRAALSRAHRALYGNWSLRGQSASTALPHLSRRNGHYALDQDIRRRVTFEYLNLALDVYPSFATGTWGMDLILCRNVLIYFDAETVQKVARQLFESLAPGGWLITASSDPPLSGFASYETVVTDRGVFYRRGTEFDSARAEASTPSLRSLLATSGTAYNFTPPAAYPSEPLEPKRQIKSQVSRRRARKAVRTKSTEQNAVDVVTGLPAALVEAQRAFARGEYSRAATLSGSLTTHDAACALHVRSLANLNAAEAVQACAQATARQPLSAELHYLHALLLLDQGREEEASRSLRRVIYLDRTLAMAHFTLGSVLQRQGDLDGARRAYRNAGKLSSARPADEVVPLSEGEHAGRLAEAAAVQLAILYAAVEVA